MYTVSVGHGLLTMLAVSFAGTTRGRLSIDTWMKYIAIPALRYVRVAVVITWASIAARILVHVRSFLGRNISLVRIGVEVSLQILGGTSILNAAVVLFLFTNSTSFATNSGFVQG